MTIQELITLAEARVLHLNQLKADAMRFGDVERLIQLDRELADTESTLIKLKGAA